MEQQRRRVIFQHELLYEFAQDLDPLLKLHIKEVGQTEPIDPDWVKYAYMEQQGQFLGFTARAGKKLVGYAGFFIGKHPHHKTLTLVSNDVVYLHPAHRKGRTGLRFIDFCVSELKAAHPEFALTWSAKPGSNLHLILSHAGYSQESTMTKILRGN
jgi:hypothetical protein